MKKEGYALETDYLEVNATDVSSIRAPKRMPKVPLVTKSVVEARSLDIAKAKLGFVEYGYADKKIIPSNISKKDFYTIGVQAKWNLYNGGADIASLEKAKVNHLKVATQVALAKKGIWLKASKFKAEIKRTYKAKYQEGITSITDVLIKQSTQTQILMQLLKVKNERDAKILELQNLING